MLGSQFGTMSAGVSYSAKPVFRRFDNARDIAIFHLVFRCQNGDPGLMLCSRPVVFCQKEKK